MRAGCGVSRRFAVRGAHPYHGDRKSCRARNDPVASSRNDATATCTPARLTAHTTRSMTLFSSIARIPKRGVASTFTLIAAAALIAPRTVAAQATKSAPPTATDSTAHGSTTQHRFRHQNVWLSGGLGGGGANGQGLAGIGSLWYTYGPVALGVRSSQGGPWERETDTHEKAALIGLRARRTHSFILAAVGGGTMAESVSNGEQSGSRTYFPAEHSFATSIEAAVTYKVVGIGIDAFTAQGRRTTYRGLALSVQLGYLE